MKRLVIALGFVGVLGGCATSLNGSVPAGNGQILAVGSRNNQATAWLCPAAPGPCKIIDVQEKSK
jgi:hypothetical protein